MIFQSNHFQQVLKKYNSIEDALNGIPGIIVLQEPTPLQIPLLPELFEKSITLKNGISFQPRKGICNCRKNKADEMESAQQNPCKHLLTYYLAHTQQHLTELQKSLFEQCKISPSLLLYVIRMQNNVIYVLHSENSDWIKLFSEDAPEKVYSFNLRKKRWAYNSEPTWQEEIQNVLKDYFLVTG